MKLFYNLIAFFIAISAYAQTQTVTYSISPSSFNEDESITISNSRKLVDVWNRIIHGYDSVSDDVIWGIVIKLNIFLLYRLKSKNY